MKILTLTERELRLKKIIEILDKWDEENKINQNLTIGDVVELAHKIDIHYVTKEDLPDGKAGRQVKPFKPIAYYKCKSCGLHIPKHSALTYDICSICGYITCYDCLPDGKAGRRVCKSCLSADRQDLQTGRQEGVKEIENRYIRRG
jgi:hypothetical protein